MRSTQNMLRYVVAAATTSAIAEDVYPASSLFSRALVMLTISSATYIQTATLLCNVLINSLVAEFAEGKSQIWRNINNNQCGYKLKYILVNLNNPRAMRSGFRRLRQQTIFTFSTL